MLNQYLGDTSDEKGRKAIRAIARRVASVAEVYDHLLGSEMTRTTDFGGYITSLCRTLADTQATSRITLTCKCDEVRLNLDVVTALGIVVAELVTNSFDHAFPGGEGAITVTVRGPADGSDMASVTVSDNGRGFTPQAESKRRGLGLAHRLVEQVRATLGHTSDGGTDWVLTFPVTTEPVSAAI
jgi:two-component sensor histidine kinase